METTVDEIADGIYRLSTHIPDIAPPAGFTFNQFLIDAEEPMLFHCGSRQLFPLVSAAAARVVPLERLRWITFGHIESDECGSMNDWLAAAPAATVAFNGLGCLLSVADMADRAPRPVEADEVVDLGGRRIRLISTPHVPHNWEAQVLYEELTGTLLCGDILTHFDGRVATTTDDVVEGALMADAAFGGTSLTPSTAPTLRALADLNPSSLGLMHGSSVVGDSGADQLRRLADAYESQLAQAVPAAV